jgi:hypothetical protein
MTYQDSQTIENSNNNITVDTIINEHINECIEQSKQDSKVLGVIKYFYYISPLGWMFSNEKHKLTLEITKQMLKSNE